MPSTNKLAIATCLSLALAMSGAAGAAEHYAHLSTQELAAVLRHGPWPAPAQPDPGNELSGKPLAQKLGEKLFDSAAMSANGSIACASCHQKSRGFADNRSRAAGLAQHGRNSQSLWNTDLQRWFGWDGGADSLWAATLRPLLSAVEMGATLKTIAAQVQAESLFVANRPDFERAYPALRDNPSDETISVFAAKAIGAYVQTLRSPRTSFDRLRDKLSDAHTGENADDLQSAVRPSFYPTAAWRGLKLFVGKARCHVCHYGPNFSNGEFHDIGRPFILAPGKIDPGRYRGIQRVRSDRYNQAGQFSAPATNSGPAAANLLKLGQVNWGQWRTPSLRNLALTAPYMHDGSVATLRAAVDWYADIDVTRLHSNGETILKPLSLTDQQRNDLVAFLLTLSPDK